MNNRLHRLRKPVALVAGLAVAATISVVAPATATAATPKKGTSTVRVVDQPAKGQVGGAKVVHSNDWSW